MTFITKKALQRRTFLRGMGATVALPLLDAMMPALSAKSVKPTPRLGFIYAANGVIQNQWIPTTTGRDFALPPILKPLEPVRSHINVLSGLSHLQADTFGDGTGDHPRSSAVWLTGVHAYDRSRPDIEVRLATSADQIAAREIGKVTQTPSVEMNPLSAPRTRSFLVSARVSIPWRPGRPCCARYSASEHSARQLLTTRESSRMTNPATCGRHDSTSCRLTP